MTRQRSGWLRQLLSNLIDCPEVSDREQANSHPISTGWNMFLGGRLASGKRTHANLPKTPYSRLWQLRSERIVDNQKLFEAGFGTYAVGLCDETYLFDRKLDAQ